MQALREQSGRTDLKNISRAMEAETVTADNMTKEKHLKKLKARSVSGVVNTREQILFPCEESQERSMLSQTVLNTALRSKNSHNQQLKEGH